MISDSKSTPLPILDHPLISARYFFPSPAPFSLANPILIPLSGERRGDVQDEYLHCWRSAPPSPEQKLIVHFHGNGELVHHWIQPLTPIFQRAGFEVLFVEYRGYGRSGGTPQLEAMLDDLDAIAERCEVPLAHVVPFGRSIGSLYAIEWVKRFPESLGLIIESGIHDLLERISLRVTPEELNSDALSLSNAVHTRFDQGAKLSQFEGPSLFLHAIQDHLVSIAHAERNLEATQGKGTLIRFPWGDHNSIFSANFEDYRDEVIAFLRALEVR